MDDDLRLELVKSWNGLAGYVPELRDQDREVGFIKVGEMYERKVQGVCELWSTELGGL